MFCENVGVFCKNVVFCNVVFLTFRATVKQSQTVSKLKSSGEMHDSLLKTKEVGYRQTKQMTQQGIRLRT